MQWSVHALNVLMLLQIGHGGPLEQESAQDSTHYTPQAPVDTLPAPDLGTLGLVEMLPALDL